MIELYKQVVTNQYLGALRTLSLCVERCPESHWNMTVGNLKFSQVAFHTLFFADCYMGRNSDELKQQQFHLDHPEFFRDYEEMEDRRQVLLYDRPTILLYMEHCRQKGSLAIASETAESLAGESGFYWLKFPRAEVHSYNTRHIQHHAAQLSLKLRNECGVEIPWVGSGWKSFT